METRMVVTCAAITALLFLPKAHASANETQTVGWQSDPNGRGTFTLVSSCLLTLLICVYSAMHLNVPPYGESTLQFWVRNIKWALLGIFGPELIVFIAWKQYQSANTIRISSEGSINVESPALQESQIEKRTDTVSTSSLSFRLRSC